MSNYRQFDRRQKQRFDSRYDDRDRDSNRHRERDREQRPYQMPSSNPGPPTCYNCGKLGHYRPNCPDLKTGDQQSASPNDTVVQFAMRNPGLLEEFIATKVEREKQEKRDKELQLLTEAVRLGNQPLLASLTPPQRPRPYIGDDDEEESPVKKRKLDKTNLIPSPKTALLTSLSTQMDEIKSAITPPVTGRHSAGLNPIGLDFGDNFGTPSAYSGIALNGNKRNLSPHEEDMRQEINILREEMSRRDRELWETMKNNEIQNLREKLRYEQEHRMNVIPTTASKNAYQPEKDKDPIIHSAPDDLVLMENKLLAVRTRVERKRQLAKEIEKAEAEEAALAATADKRERSEEIIRKELLKNLIEIESGATSDTRRNTRLTGNGVSPQHDIDSLRPTRVHVRRNERDRREESTRQGLLKNLIEIESTHEETADTRRNIRLPRTGVSPQNDTDSLPPTRAHGRNDWQRQRRVEPTHEETADTRRNIRLTRHGVSMQHDIHSLPPTPVHVRGDGPRQRRREFLTELHEKRSRKNANSNGLPETGANSSGLPETSVRSDNIAGGGQANDTTEPDDNSGIDNLRWSSSRQTVVDIANTSDDDNSDGDTSDLGDEADDEALNKAADDAAAIARSRFIYTQSLKMKGESGRQQWNKEFMKAECKRLRINFTGKHLMKTAEKLAAAAHK